jgi:uncharacterized protein (DUF1778 family)
MAGRVTISVHVPMDSYGAIMRAIELSGEKTSAFFLAGAEERAARVFAARPAAPVTGAADATPQS